MLDISLKCFNLLDFGRWTLPKGQWEPRRGGRRSERPHRSPCGDAWGSRNRGHKRTAISGNRPPGRW